MREEYREDGWIGLGNLRGIVVVVVYTESGEEAESVRIISMRKAKKHEREFYEKKFSY